MIKIVKLDRVTKRILKNLSSFLFLRNLKEEKQFGSEI